MSDGIRVLHVDDDPEMTALASEFLVRESDRFEVLTETDARAGLDRLDDECIDCIVSDYDMPGIDGLEFLETVREDSPELPFILFTGKGSEAVASDAISAGVSDYLQKGPGTDKYTLLANRIQNVVDQYRAERALDETRRRFSKLLEHSTDVISILDADGTFRYVSPSSERILGYTPDDLEGTLAFEYAHPDDRQRAIEKFAGAVDDPGARTTVEFRLERSDGRLIHLESRGRNLLDDPDVDGFVVNSRDVTDQRIQCGAEQIEGIVAHDLRNPLRVAQDTLELLDAEAIEDESIERIDRSLREMDGLIEDLLAYARGDSLVTSREVVDVSEIAAAAWETTPTAEATLDRDAAMTVDADEGRLKQLLANLFRNAVEHGSTDATVRVGDDDRSFFVEDDGPGIDAAVRDRIFETGWSDRRDGNGLGLAIVDRIARAHGWTASVTEGSLGGARFEITGVESATNSNHDSHPDRSNRTGDGDGAEDL
ncbi:response regulator [Halococcoides cellulosivorans]|uniref:Hybrid sensor histidine kinase/response regulator n=1 Tax=Halococcoides cellulosivorans TaxID=1679096 RepID=A0A2R4WZT5_9EURY|nr:response regulator [Halococcoides cellulosivorans]AWB27058.1 hybrid sensor histidine kinase/response regulator [Halococcoides cellulosivorans]